MCCTAQRPSATYQQSSAISFRTRTPTLITLLLSLLARAALSAECFPKSQNLLPKVLTGDHTNGISAQNESYHSIVGNDEFIIVGGTSNQPQITPESGNSINSVLTRMDLAQNTVRWMKYIRNLRHIEAMALKSDATELATYSNKLSNSGDPTLGDRVGFLVIFRADDGLPLVTEMYMEIKLSGTSSLSYLTSSSAMFFTDYGKVILAWHLQQSSPNSSSYLMQGGDQYEGNILIAQWDRSQSETELEFLREQDTYFGQASAIAYGHWGASTSNIYLGGAVDNNRYISNAQAMEWAPFIYHLTSNLLKEEQWKIQLGGSWQTSLEDHAMIDHMKLHQGTTDYLFGTTRTHLRPTSTGTHTQIHVWRVRLLASTHKVDSSGGFLVAKIDPAGLGAQSYVTGISNSLENSETEFHLTYFDPTNQKLFYMRPSLLSSSTTVQSIEIYRNIDYIKETAFVGSSVGAIGAYSYIKQAYAVGYSKLLTNASQTSIGTGSNSMGIILPSLREESCLEVFESVSAISLTHLSSTTTLTLGNEAEFVDFLYDFNTKQMEMWDLDQSLLFPNTQWCSTFSSPVTTIAPGYTHGSGSCELVFDGTTLTEIPFTRPQIIAPQCDDYPLPWTVWIECYSCDAKRWTVSTSLDSDKFYVKGFLGQSDGTTYNARANWMLPDGTISFFDFEINTSSSTGSCSYPTITAPAFTASHNYSLGGPTSSYAFPAFTVTGSCSLTYDQLIVGSATAADTSFFTIVSALETQWVSSDNSHLGSYTVTVKASSGCSFAQETYTVNVQGTCSTDTLTVDSVQFASPAATYDIRSASLDFSWTDTAVVSDNGLTSCGSFTWEITQTDGLTAIDASIFTEGDYSLATKTIGIYSEDITQQGTYNMRVTVYYTDYPAVTANLDFSIVLQDYCNTNVVITPPAAIADQSYTVGDSQNDQTWSAFTWTPSYCVMTTLYAITPTPSDSAAISVDTATFIVSIYTTNHDSGIDTAVPATPMTYTVLVYLQTEGLTDHSSGGEEWTFDVVMTDPCFSATIDLSYVVPSLTPSYMIGDAADVQQFVFANADDGVTTSCPTLIFTLTNQDGSAIDASIFTFDSTSEQLTTLTSDLSFTGDYPLRLTVQFSGAYYSNSASIDFTMTLVDPCLTATINLVSSPWPLSSFTYATGDPDVTQSWTAASMYSLSTSVDCGPFTVTFLQQASSDAVYSALDPAVFSVSTEQFTKTTTVDLVQVDVYNIVYTVSLDNYAVSSAQSDPFVITVADSCLTATLTKPAQTDPLEYMYSGSSPQAEFTVADFTVTPSHCTKAYSCATTSGPAGYVDLCTINSAPTIGSFDPIAVQWAFSTTDVPGVPSGTYTISITCTTGTLQDIATQHDFTFVLTNPCPTATISFSATNPVFVADVYDLSSSTLSEQTWDYTIATSDSDPAECGEYSIQIQIDAGNPTIESLFVIDQTAKTLQYASGADLSHQGPYSLTYKVFYTDYPSAITAGFSNPSTLEFIDNCLAPSLSVSSVPQVSPDYMYTGSSPSLSIGVNPAGMITVSVPQCAITYSCTVLSGPAAGHFSDCVFTDGLNSGSFDTTTGEWILNTNAPMNALYPPGAYVIRITGTAGTLSDVTVYSDISVNLVDPCPTALSITNPFSDASYTLRESPLEQSYASGLVSFSTSAWCGPTSYAAFNSDTGVEIQLNDQSQVIYIDTTNEVLKIGYSEDASIAGSHSMYYKFVLNYYPASEVTSSVVTYTVIDPCSPPNSIYLSSAIAPQTYTIGMNQLSVLVPFETDPAWCDIASVYIGTDTALIYYDPATLVATVFNDSDLSFSGSIAAPYEQLIPVDFTATSDTLSTTASFQLIVKNPCANNVSINTPADYSVAYSIGTPSLVIDFAAGYSVGTSQQIQSLCGAINYTVISGLSTEISLSAQSNELHVFSTDTQSLPETQQVVEIDTKLEEYPLIVIGSTLRITVEFVLNGDVSLDLAVEFDLLADTEVSVPLPASLSSSQSYWAVHSETDELELTQAFPENFQIQDSGSMVIKHTVSDFEERKAFYALDPENSFYFQERLKSTFEAVGSKYSFKILFTDACRSAQIADISIEFPSVTWLQDQIASIEIPELEDSVGSGGYDSDICGEKTFTLSEGSPSFLTVKREANQIVYKQGMASEHDIGVNVVNFSVVLTQYQGIADFYIGEFEFSIKCPSTYEQIWLQEPLYQSVVHNLLTPDATQVTLPEVAVSPEVCFAVTNYMVLDAQTDSTPSYITLDGLNLSIQTQEESLIGTHPLSYTVVVEKTSTTITHELATFELEFTLGEQEGSLTMTQMQLQSEEKKLKDELVREQKILAESLRQEWQGMDLPVPSAKIKQVSRSGLITIEFSKPMNQKFLENNAAQSSEGQSIAEQFYAQLKDDEMVGVELIDNADYDEPLNKRFAWRVVSYISDEMLIQMDFEKPTDVSTPDFDKVIVIFHITTLIFDQFGQELPEQTQLTKMIPTQFSSAAEQELYDGFSGALSTVGTGSFSSDVVLNTAIAATWQQLFSPIASHQIIMFMPLLKVSYPANAGHFCQMLLEVASFDAIPADEINKEVYKEEEEAANGNESHANEEIGDFEKLGYSGSHILPNLTSPMTMLFASTLVNLSFLAMTYMSCCCKCIRARKSQAVGTILWNLPLGFFIESYSVITICCLLNLADLSWAGTAAAINSAFAILTLALLVGFPLLTNIFLRMHFRDLRSENFKNKYGAVYDRLRTNNSRNLIYLPFYLYRRLTIPASVLFFSNSLVAQYLSIQISGSAIICFVLSRQPFDSRFKNLAVVVEELVIVVLVNHSFYFSDWMTDSAVRQALGISFISIIMSILGIFHVYNFSSKVITCCKQRKKKSLIKKARIYARLQREQQKFSVRSQETQQRQRMRNSGNQHDARPATEEVKQQVIEESKMRVPAPLVENINVNSQVHRATDHDQLQKSINKVERRGKVHPSHGQQKQVFFEEKKFGVGLVDQTPHAIRIRISIEEQKANKDGQWNQDVLDQDILMLEQDFEQVVQGHSGGEHHGGRVQEEDVMVIKRQEQVDAIDKLQADIDSLLQMTKYKYDP